MRTHQPSLFIYLTFQCKRSCVKTACNPEGLPAQLCQDLILAPGSHGFAVIRLICHFRLGNKTAICIAGALEDVPDKADHDRQAEEAHGDAGKRLDCLNTADAAQDNEHSCDHGKHDAPEQLQENGSLGVLIRAIHAHTGQGDSHRVALSDQRDGNDDQHHDLGDGAQRQDLEHGQGQRLGALTQIDAQEVDAIPQLGMQDRAAEDGEPHDAEQGGQQPFNENELTKRPAMGTADHEQAQQRRIGHPVHPPVHNPSSEATYRHQDRARCSA